MECQEAKELMSDYLEQYLADSEASLLEEHLSDCGECRSELAELSGTLQVVHGLPREEPARDLWGEFAPKVARMCAEMRPGLLARVRLYFSRLFAALVEGWMIFTAAVRYNMGGNVRRYT